MTRRWNMIGQYVNESQRIRASECLIMKPIVIFQEQGVKAFEIIMKNGGKRNSRRTGDVKQIAKLHGTLNAPHIKHPLPVTANTIYIADSLR